MSDQKINLTGGEWYLLPVYYGKEFSFTDLEGVVFVRINEQSSDEFRCKQGEIFKIEFSSLLIYSEDTKTVWIRHSQKAGSIPAVPANSSAGDIAIEISSSLDPVLSKASSDPMVSTSLDEIDDQTIDTLETEIISAASTSKIRVTISRMDYVDGIVRVGKNPNVSKGQPLAIGETVEFQTSSALSVYNPLGSSVIVSVTEEFKS